MRCSSLFEVHGCRQGHVASVSEGGHNQSAVVALVLKTVREGSVGLLDRTVCRLALESGFETELLLPLEGVYRETGLRKDVSDVSGVHLNCNQSNQL